MRPRQTSPLPAVALGGLLALHGCAPPPSQEPEDATGAAARIAFTGATIIDGTGADPVADGVLLVADGIIEAMGPATDVPVPMEAQRVALDGTYIVPGLINVHGHVGTVDGLDSGPETHTRANVAAQLALYARYGVTTVISLGDPGTHTLPMRAERDSAELARARIHTSGPVVTSATAQAAARDVAELAALGADWIKIRVDDALGRAQKMPPEVYGAVIEEAHRHGLPVAAHLVYLEDAKELLRRGVDLLAHSVRDAPVDSELIELMLASGICLTPTLTRELSVFVYAQRPEFFDDPFFLREADAAVLAQLQDPARQTDVRDSEAARYFRDALPLAMQNMVDLHAAGVRIAMGTDSGAAARFQGYFEHLELEMMQAAGMAPRDVLLAATRDAADCARLPDVGTLTPGRWADFIVLDDNPLDDVRALRSIREVRVAGNRVEARR